MKSLNFGSFFLVVISNWPSGGLQLFFDHGNFIFNKFPQCAAIDAHSDLFCIFCAQNSAISSKASLDHHKQELDLWSCIKIGKWGAVACFNQQAVKKWMGEQARQGPQEPTKPRGLELWSLTGAVGAREPEMGPSALACHGHGEDFLLRAEAPFSVTPCHWPLKHPKITQKRP